VYINLKAGSHALGLAFVSRISLSTLGVVEYFYVLQSSFRFSFLGFLASRPYWWVQWTSIGVVMIKKHFFKFLVMYCLIKSFKVLLKIKEQLNKEKRFLIHFPFWKVLPNLIKS
jgi:hypothetical protein